MRLVQANPLIWADFDSAGWAGWEVLNVHLLILKHTGNSCEETGYSRSIVLTVLLL